MGECHTGLARKLEWMHTSTDTLWIHCNTTALGTHSQRGFSRFAFPKGFLAATSAGYFTRMCFSISAKSQFCLHFLSAPYPFPAGCLLLSPYVDFSSASAWAKETLEIFLSLTKGVYQHSGRSLGKMNIQRHSLWQIVFNSFDFALISLRVLLQGLLLKAREKMQWLCMQETWVWSSVLQGPPALPGVALESHWSQNNKYIKGN